MTTNMTIKLVKKDGEPRNQVLEEGLKSEEGWHEILHILINFLRI